MGNGSPYLLGSAGAWNEVVMVESRWEAHRGRPEVWNGRKALSMQSLYCMKDQKRRIRFTKCYLWTDSFKLCFFYQLDITVIIFYGINALLNIRLVIHFFFSLSLCKQFQPNSIRRMTIQGHREQEHSHFNMGEVFCRLYVNHFKSVTSIEYICICVYIHIYDLWVVITPWEW